MACSVVLKNVSFYFSSYFEGSPPAEDPYGVMWWRRSCLFLRSYVPMNRFFDGMDQENSKPQGG